MTVPWPGPVEADSAGLLELLRYHGLVGRAASVAGRGGHLPPGLGQVWVAAVASTTQLLRSLPAVVSAGVASGTRLAVLKGPSAALDWPDPWNRTFSDLDVLVDAEGAPRYIDALREQGTVHFDGRAEDVVRAAWSRRELHLTLTAGGRLDVHLGLVHPASVHRHLPVDDALLLDGVQSRAIDGNPVPTLAPAAQALALAIHAVLDGAQRLSWAVDLHHALDRCTPDELVTTARQHEAVLPLAVMLDRLRRLERLPAAYADLPLPRSVWRHGMRLVHAYQGVVPHPALTPSGKSVLTSTRRSTARSVQRLAQKSLDAARGRQVSR